MGALGEPIVISFQKQSDRCRHLKFHGDPWLDPRACSGNHVYVASHDIAAHGRRPYFVVADLATDLRSFGAVHYGIGRGGASAPEGAARRLIGGAAIPTGDAGGAGSRGASAATGSVDTLITRLIAATAG